VARIFERFMDYGFTAGRELLSGKPSCGFAQTGGAELTPCNRRATSTTVKTAVREGIRDGRRHSDGIPAAPDFREFAAANCGGLTRNLAYLSGLVEILHGVRSTQSC